VAFSFSTSYPLSLALLALVGVAWASLDALLPTVLQRSVEDTERGAVVGIWNLSRGFGPFGQIGIGALAAAVGVAAAQAASGLAFVATFAVVSLLARRRTAA
jgi:sugar phosphate permease